MSCNRLTVSAMFVARTILRTPTGGRLKTLRCSAAGTMLCRGRTMYLLLLRALCLPSSCSFSRMISSHPAHSAHTIAAGVVGTETCTPFIGLLALLAIKRADREELRASTSASQGCFEPASQ